MTDTLSQKDIQDWYRRIDNMTHKECAELWRFAPFGGVLFDTKQPIFEYFKKKFDSYGGMTPEISQEIGWAVPVHYNL